MCIVYAVSFSYLKRDLYDVYILFNVFYVMSDFNVYFYHTYLNQVHASPC